jgi:soluble lytic murein transglycosylase-like protein
MTQRKPALPPATTAMLRVIALIAAGLGLSHPAAAAGADDGCRAHMEEAADRYGIPDGVLRAIGEIESNLNPMALNIGGRVYMPDSMEEATSLLYHQGQPRRDSNIGCMQIHTGWHLDAVDGRPEQFLNADVNVDYAASLLRQLYEMTGSWPEAVGRYHTGPGYPGFQRYICAVDRQLRENGAETRLGCF